MQPLPPKPVGDYVQTAAFGKHGTRFAFGASGMKGTGGSGEDNVAVKTYWEKKGLAPDPSGRQMENYFNFEGWQEEMQGRETGRKKRQRAQLP
jgi:hypothetical protein